MLCTLLCGSPSSVDQACWLRYLRFCPLACDSKQASTRTQDSVRNGHARRENLNSCILPPACGSAPTFVHMHHILKVFLRSEAVSYPRRYRGLGATLDRRQQKNPPQTHSSIEWLIPNLIFHAILGNADNSPDSRKIAA